MHLGKKLTVLQFSTFVNKNIAIMLDSGIDIVVLLQGGANLFQGENSSHPVPLALIKLKTTAKCYQYIADFTRVQIQCRQEVGGASSYLLLLPLLLFYPICAIPNPAKGSGSDH